ITWRTRYSREVRDEDFHRGNPTSRSGELLIYAGVRWRPRREGVDALAGPPFADRWPAGRLQPAPGPGWPGRRGRLTSGQRRGAYRTCQREPPYGGRLVDHVNAGAGGQRGPVLSALASAPPTSSMRR